ncbi:F-box protein [Aspergillus mulundensis]|uniref:F-box domain-containing protein n=1 Tax=Aspergillus mulundensis TaxID=1810919 RepID=A0A3D8QIB2_9EURO|nr:hypothetical protein DSM5745_10652 [Aspergillus mulundensis]RDW61154.1 hypothetical protein DSM5745_10652 [Aspergillus mulundensis]
MASEGKKRKRAASVSSTDRQAKRYRETENPRDPMLLPADIRKTIFDHLPMSEIIHCRSVSKTWNGEIQGWMEKYPVQAAKHLRPFWNTSIPNSVWNKVSEDDIKKDALLYGRLQSGKHTSRIVSVTRETEVYDSPEWNLTVGAFNCQIKHSEEREEYYVCWRSLQGARSRKVLSLGEDIFDGDYVRGVHFLLMNTDGAILVDAQTQYGPENRSRRLIVYSQYEEYTMWEHIYPHANDDSFKVLGLGESRIYCAIRQDNNDEYDFVAINFRNGKTLYRVSIPHLTWDRILDSTAPCKVLSSTSHTDETVVFTGNVRPVDQALEDSTDMVIVINGRTGHRYPDILCSPARSIRCIGDSMTGQYALTWCLQASDVPPELQNAHPELADHHITLARTFSAHSGTGEHSSSGAMVVVHPRPFNYNAVHPFAMIAMDYQYQDHGDFYSQYLTCHPLVLTRDNAIWDAASAVTKWFFQDPTAVTIGCFTPGDGVVVKLPETRAALAHKTGSLGLPPGTRFISNGRIGARPRPTGAEYTTDLCWTDDACLMVEDPDETLIFGFGDPRCLPELD